MNVLFIKFKNVFVYMIIRKAGVNVCQREGDGMEGERERDVGSVIMSQHRQIVLSWGPQDFIVKMYVQ